MPLALRSSAFETAGRIPQTYTCDGEDISPPLSWSGVPSHTKSFVLVCTDPDAPKGVFHHWAVYDISPDINALSEGSCATRGSGGIRQAVNDFGKRRYNGPCPPHGHGPHHYHFHLSALREPHLAVSSSATCREVIAAAKSLAVESALLIGIYER